MELKLYQLGIYSKNIINLDVFKGFEPVFDCLEGALEQLGYASVEGMTERKVPTVRGAEREKHGVETRTYMGSDGLATVEVRGPKYRDPKKTTHSGNVDLLLKIPYVEGDKIVLSALRDHKLPKQTISIYTKVAN